MQGSTIGERLGIRHAVAAIELDEVRSELDDVPEGASYISDRRTSRNRLRVLGIPSGTRGLEEETGV